MARELRPHGRAPGILEVLKQLWGPSIRFDVSKLNLKAAGYGAPVEWHQDWAFYPHTNDDLAAVGIMMDDVDDANGPLMVLPGSHLGPIFDHHDEAGFFCGAIDPGRGEVDFSRAVKLTGPAGSITIHHARTVHGSATNTSGRPRRLLLHQYRAADAWPIMGVPDYAAYRAMLLCGEEMRAAPGAGAGPPAAAAGRKPGLDLREPAYAQEPLLPNRRRARAGGRRLSGFRPPLRSGVVRHPVLHEHATLLPDPAVRAGGVLPQERGAARDRPPHHLRGRAPVRPPPGQRPPHRPPPPPGRPLAARLSGLRLTGKGAAGSLGAGWQARRR